VKRTELGISKGGEKGETQLRKREVSQGENYKKTRSEKDEWKSRRREGTEQKGGGRS